MRFFDFVSVKLTICLVGGIVLGYYLEISPRIPFCAMLIILPFLFWASSKQGRKGFLYFELLTIFINVLLGVFVVNLAQSKSLESHYSNTDLNEPKLWELKVREVLKSNQFSHSYVANVQSVDGKNRDGKLILRIRIDSLAKKLKVDDEFLLFSNARPVPPPLNPHQFNYKDFLEKQGIYHQVSANFAALQHQTNPSKTFLGIASNFRDRIISQLRQESFGQDELAVIQALVLGQRDDISEEVYNNYKNAGAVHILAVSGLHVGILLLLLQFLFTPLEKLSKGKILKLVFVVLLLWGYAFIAGLSPSIVRAVTMFTFVAYAMHLNRPTNSFNIVTLSMFFILLVKPLFLFQVGFQMSYAAVFAIVWIYPKLQRFWFPENIAVRKAWQLLAVSISAQLGVLPISLFYFHQFPALFFISNLVIVPFLGLILGMGILVIILSLWDFVPKFLVVAYDAIIWAMNSIVAWVAEQESFVIKDIPFDAIQLLLGYFIIVMMVHFLSQPKWKSVMILLTGIITWQGWGIWNQFQLRENETLILAHQTKNSLLLHQTGPKLQLFTSDTARTQRLVKNYTVAERIQSTSQDPLKNNYKINQKELYIMDSLAIYPNQKGLDYLLLTQSPKINLIRLVDSLKPKMILVDGSNYKSYIRRWKTTCVQKEIPFHNTGEKGFYVFILNED